jgi:geranylgeranyl diphosphate synthase type II
MEFEAWAAGRRARVEEALRTALAEGEVPPRLRAAMGHLLLAGGKRLRPLCAIGAAEAVGGDLASALPVGVALEMIHTYSLLHDDLPCMDDDDLRRGLPTCHRVFGEALALLAGDALLARAFEVLSRAAGKAGWPFSLIEEVARAAGSAGMVGGQVLDLEGEGRELTLEEVERMHALKTGALFVASVRAGALSAGAGAEALDALTAYARPLGLAFQVQDDLLDVVGDRQALGKPVGQDAAHAKSTFPALCGVEASRARARALAQEAIEALALFGPSADPLRALAALSVTRDR